MTDEALEVRLAPLVIEKPWESLRVLLKSDWSRIYDGYIRSGDSPPNRVVDEDVHVINRSMATRSQRARWEPIIEAGDLAELKRLDPAWDLILMSDADWQREHVLERIEDAVTTLVRPYIAVAAASKVLHIKRPALIPVCDADILGRLAVTDREPSKAVAAACTDIRREGQRLREPLLALQAQVKSELKFEITLTRILEMLIWRSHPNRRGYRVKQ